MRWERGKDDRHRPLFANLRGRRRIRRLRFPRLGVTKGEFDGVRPPLHLRDHSQGHRAHEQLGHRMPDLEVVEFHFVHDPPLPRRRHSLTQNDPVMMGAERDIHATRSPTRDSSSTLFGPIRTPILKQVPERPWGENQIHTVAIVCGGTGNSRSCRSITVHRVDQCRDILSLGFGPRNACLGVPRIPLRLISSVHRTLLLWEADHLSCSACASSLSPGGRSITPMTSPSSQLYVSVMSLYHSESHDAYPCFVCIGHIVEVDPPAGGEQSPSAVVS